MAKDYNLALLYMAVRQSTHGVRDLMQEGLSKTQAEAWLRHWDDPRRPVHHQTYFIFPYTPQTKRARMDELKIDLG